VNPRTIINIDFMEPRESRYVKGGGKIFSPFFLIWDQDQTEKPWIESIQMEITNQPTAVGLPINSNAETEPTAEFFHLKASVKP
jgi:hypothetical protein